MLEEYIFSGSLPENASTYFTREADKELYEGLKVGKFCYFSTPDNRENRAGGCDNSCEMRKLLVRQ